MGFIRQTLTLTWKNLLIVLFRHAFATVLRAFVLPVVFMFFISYAKNFFVPPSDFGIGSPSPLLSLSQSLHAGDPGRTTVAFVNNGHTGGQIEAVINDVAQQVSAAGKQVQFVNTDEDLFTTCPSSLRGVSPCFAAASFDASPTEGNGSFWNYTIRADGALGEKIFVGKSNNDAQIYILPFQHAIDDAIIRHGNGTTLPSNVQQYPYTSETTAQRNADITRLYMQTLIDILAVAFYVGIVGVTYQLTGQMASERELGMSQLIEAMTPNKRRWHTQAARLLSYHLAFDIIYLPGWLLMGYIVWTLDFPNSNPGLVIISHLLAGLSLTSFSILGAALFRKAQLSGITITIVSIILAIVAQVAGLKTDAAVGVTSFLFPSMNYVFLIIYFARFERITLGVNISQSPPHSPWQIPGYVFWIFFVIQIFVYPVLGAWVENTLYGTSSKARRLHNDPNSPDAITLDAFSKTYYPGWWNRNVTRRFGGKLRDTVHAVDDFSLHALRGQVMVLLGANGSGKSTTLNCIAGLDKITSGGIELDGTGGLGLCPQKNVLWDELNVFEHVQIFNSLKTTTKRDSKTQIAALIESCDLTLKIREKSTTLSGGQKRKLQLAMMFTGGSRVCAIDEVSSGLDPLSRRKIWDILLAERGVRTLLLTTHFLDEADVLSDHIALLSKGKLRAEGSSVELKNRFGGGYRVHLAPHLPKVIPPPGCKVLSKQIRYTDVVYQIADSASASLFINHLDELKISDYEVNGPTIEDVFLKLAEEVKEDLPSTAEDADISEDASNSEPAKVEEDIMITEVKSSGSGKGPQLSKGKGTAFFRQTWILFVKRTLILRRNYLPYVAAVLIPAFAAGLVTLFIKGFTALGCTPAAQSSVQEVLSLSDDIISPLIPVGPPSAISNGTLEAITAILGTNMTIFQYENTVTAFNDFISTRFANVTPGGVFLGSPPVFAFEGEYDMTFALLTQNLLDVLLSGTPIATQFEPFAVAFAPTAGHTLQLILYFGLAMCIYPGFFALYPTVERLKNVRSLHYSNGVKSAPLWLAYVIFDFLFVLLVSLVVTVVFVARSSAWYYPGYLFVVFFLYGLTSTLWSYAISLFVSSQLAAFAISAGSQAVFFLCYFIAYMSIITYSSATTIDMHVTIAHFTISLVTPAGSMLRAMLLTLNEFSLLCDGHEVYAYPGDIMVYGGPILYLVVQTFVLFGFLVWWENGHKMPFSLFNRRRSSDPEAEAEEVEPQVLVETERVDASNDSLRVLHASKQFGRNLAVDNVTFGVQQGETFALLGPNGAGKSTTISLIRGDIRPSNPEGDVMVEATSIRRDRTRARVHLGVCPQFDAIDTLTVTEHLRFYARARGVPDVMHNVDAVIDAVGLHAFRTRMAEKLSGGNKRKLSLAIALIGNPAVLLLDEPSSGMDAASKRVMWKTLSSVAAGRALVITTHSMEEADALADRAGIMARRMLALGRSDDLRKRYGDAFHVHLVRGDAPHTSEAEMQRVRDWVNENIPGAECEERTFHGQLRFKVPNRATLQLSESRKAEKEKDDVAPQISSTVTPLDSDFVLPDVTSPLSEASFHTAAGSPTPGAQSRTVTPMDDLTSPTSLEIVPTNGTATSQPRHEGIAALFALLEQHKAELGFEYYSVSQTTLDQVFLTIVGKHNVQEENQHATNASARNKGWKGWKARVLPWAI